MEFRVVRPDGRIVWLFTNAAVVLENGKAVRLLGATIDITERKESDAQRDLLVAELSHRVKNTLATVISIAHQSFSKGPSVEEARRSFDGRIRALAQTHGRLAEGNWSGVSFETMLADELAPYRREDGDNVHLDGPRITLSPKHAVVLGMAFHELATNAAKYGALSAKGGAVNVAWEIAQPRRSSAYAGPSSGGPAVEPPRRSGFGRLLLERAVASDLQGNVALRFAETGLTCEITMPLGAAAAQPLPEPLRHVPRPPRLRLPAWLTAVACYGSGLTDGQHSHGRSAHSCRRGRIPAGVLARGGAARPRIRRCRSVWHARLRPATGRARRPSTLRCSTSISAGTWSIRLPTNSSPTPFPWSF